MDMTQCSVGHFYDSDEYSTCPYCDACASNPLIGVESEFDRFSFQPTRERSPQPVPSSQQNISSSGRSVFPSTAGQSIFLDPAMEQQKLVCGWLVVIEGKSRGKSFEIYEDASTIGRSSQNPICIPNDPTVSRCAAAIGFDPRSCSFYCRPQPNTTSLVFVNQQPLLQHALLKKGDVISIGKTKMVLVPFCSKEFRW